MRTLEEVFIREFKDEVRLLGNKDVYSIPLPPEVKTWKVSGSEIFKVRDIKDEYYGKLNNSNVMQLPKGYEAKRRVIDKVNRSYKKDASGSFIYQDYTVPSGSIVVISPINLNLPYKRYLKDTPGFGYIDFVSIDGKTQFMYAIPKENLYRVNQTALALSVKNMKNFQGMGYLTWDKGVIYLHVIPYSPNAKYSGSIILKTGCQTSYNKEFHLISNYWEKVNLIPNIGLSSLQTEENLCLKPTIVGYESYNPIESNPISVKNIFGSEEDTNHDTSEGVTKK